MDPDTLCPRSSDPFYIVFKLLYKMGHYFLDIQYVITVGGPKFSFLPRDTAKKLFFLVRLKPTFSSSLVATFLGGYFLGFYLELQKKSPVDFLHGLAWPLMWAFGMNTNSHVLSSCTGRWKNCCGEKGRWKNNLIGKIHKVSICCIYCQDNISGACIF